MAYNEEARTAGGTICTNTLGEPICHYEMSFLANEVNTCSPPPEAVGFVNQLKGVDRPFPVTGPCPSCTGTVYVPTNALDTLRVLFFGLTHDGVYDCKSTVRTSLAALWPSLLSFDCPVGDATCKAGLVHLWRPADEAPVAQELVTLLAPPGRGLGVGLVNPFCNSLGANTGAVTHANETSDFDDLDPIRVTAQPADSLGTGTVTPFVGALGLLLPIYEKADPSVTFDEMYPTQPCSTACTPVAPIKGSLLPPGFHCPDGALPILGICYLPVIAGTSPGDPRCISDHLTKCISASGQPDGRAYNLVVTVPQPSVRLAFRGSTPFQFGEDVVPGLAVPHLLDGSFFRLHMQQGSADFNNLPGIGVCQRLDEDEQTGCLVNAESCSMGLSGVGGLQKLFPVPPSLAPGVPASNQGLIVH